LVNLTHTISSHYKCFCFINSKNRRHTLNYYLHLPIISIKQSFLERLIFTTKSINLLLQGLPFLAISNGLSLFIVQLHLGVYSPIRRLLSFVSKIFSVSIILLLIVHRLHFRVVLTFKLGQIFQLIKLRSKLFHFHPQVFFIKVVISFWDVDAIKGSLLDYIIFIHFCFEDF